jgi:Flp pilus assembly protein TadB
MPRIIGSLQTVNWHLNISQEKIRNKLTRESVVAFTSTVTFFCFSWVWISLNIASFFFVLAAVIAYRQEIAERENV